MAALVTEGHFRLAAFGRSSSERVKKVPFGSMEEAHKWSSSEWPTETINESPPRIREDESPGLEQADESMTVNEPIPTEAASPVRLSPPLAREEGPRRSERHTYLKEKYPDSQL